MAQFGNCRSCGKEIMWLRKEGTDLADGAKLNPIDVELSPLGNIEIDLDAGTYKLITAEPWKHVSHFVTCPERNNWRKKS